MQARAWVAHCLYPLCDVCTILSLPAEFGCDIHNTCAHKVTQKGTEKVQYMSWQAYFFVNSIKTVWRSQVSYDFCVRSGEKPAHCLLLLLQNYGALLLLPENDSGNGIAPLLMLNV